jgi:hypothetical protein
MANIPAFSIDIQLQKRAPPLATFLFHPQSQHRNQWLRVPIREPLRSRSFRLVGKVFSILREKRLGNGKKVGLNILVLELGSSEASSDA